MQNRLWLVALALIAPAAHADYINDYVHAEVGVGASAYQRGPDGRWVQDGFSNKLDLTAPAFEIGLTGDLYQAANWGVSWHIGYVWLGSVRTDAMVPSANTNTTSGRWIGPDLVGVNKNDPCSGPCRNLSRFKGSGHNHGFALTIEPHYDTHGWRLGVEAGPYIYRSTWSEDVDGWVSAPGAQPVTIHVQNDPKWTLGAVVGASVSRGNFTLAYRYYINKARPSDPTPPVWNATHVLMLKYRF